MGEEVGVIYGRSGQSRLMVLTDGRLVDFGGRSIGFLDSSNAYNYEGRHCGLYEDGILRDHGGDCVGFGELVADTIHPLLPSKRVRPIHSLVEVEPLRPEIKISPPKPLKTLNWSTSTPISMFYEH
ncbi:MAG: hypothetical protein V1850_01090 [Candidatus Bathyarchaeota archaeon]